MRDAKVVARELHREIVAMRKWSRSLGAERERPVALKLKSLIRELDAWVDQRFKVALDPYLGSPPTGIYVPPGVDK